MTPTELLEQLEKTLSNLGQIRNQLQAVYDEINADEKLSDISVPAYELKIIAKLLDELKQAQNRTMSIYDDTLRFLTRHQDYFQQDK